MDFWPAPEPWRRRIVRIRAGLVVAVGLLSAVALVVQYGLEGGSRDGVFIRGAFLVAAAGLVVELLLKAWCTPRGREFLRARAPALVLLLVVGVRTAVVLLDESASLNSPGIRGVGAMTYSYLVVLQLFVLAGLLLESARVNRRIAALRLAPGRLVLSLFGALIGLGTLLLLLPRATPTGREMGWLDALFTATSAVCVTGLTVLDTGRDFTPLGQGIIGGLIQLGGLGIMAFTGFLAVVAGQGLGIRERALLADVLRTPVVSQVRRRLRTIVLVTVGIEAAGALVLWSQLRGLFPERNAVGLALFHSISAFCNAGFSTLDESLVGTADSAAVNLTIIALIVLGGIGFGTIIASFVWAVQRARGQRLRVPLSARLIWITSAILWGVGALGMGLLEWNGALAHLAPADRVVGAVFHSVSTRTAGFSTIDLTALSSASLLFTIALMFIGGAPGSTAGGVKVTTVAVMGGAVVSMLRGTEQVQVAGREIAPSSIREAIVVVFVGGLAVLGGLLALLIVEPLPFLALAFEAVSALGTVGLSLGVTPQLTAAGKLILVGLMIIGRLGPLTLVLAVGSRQRSRARYPTETVEVG